MICRGDPLDRRVPFQADKPEFLYMVEHTDDLAAGPWMAEPEIAVIKDAKSGVYSAVDTDSLGKFYRLSVRFP